jgi:hypothetical protein
MTIIGDVDIGTLTSGSVALTIDGSVNVRSSLTSGVLNDLINPQYRDSHSSDEFRASLDKRTSDFQKLCDDIKTTSKAHIADKKKKVITISKLIISTLVDSDEKLTVKNKALKSAGFNIRTATTKIRKIEKDIKLIEEIIALYQSMIDDAGEEIYEEI